VEPSIAKTAQSWEVPKMSEPKSEPDGVKKEPEPPADAKERIKANARRAAELNAEREKEKKAKAGSKSGE
jgi:hypothetical protein